MEWSKGFSSQFYASFVNGNTWGDTERFEITGGSISKNTDNLKESANVECVSYQNFNERWIRIWMDVRQNDGASHVPLFTGIAMNPSRSFTGTYEKNTLTCYSVLKPVDDVLLPRGWYIPSGVDIKDSLSTLMEPTKAPIEFDEGIPTLMNDIIAEDGETNLSMANKILEAVKWRVVINGYGRVRFRPNAVDGNMIVTQPVKKFDVLDNDVLELSVDIERDWFESPNVFRAIIGEVTAIARDDDPNSMYSTVSRGREIWMEETDCNLNSGETLADYASRRLKEEQRISYKASYKRRFDPDINVTDLVTIHYPNIELDGVFMVESQTIDISGAAATSEEACLVG